MRALSTLTEDCQQAAEISCSCKGLDCSDDLCPDREHSQKQSQRGKRSGFFDDGANHDSSPCTRTRQEHSSWYVPSQAVIMRREVMRWSAGKIERIVRAWARGDSARSAPRSRHGRRLLASASASTSIFSGTAICAAPLAPSAIGKTTRASFTTG